MLTRITNGYTLPQINEAFEQSLPITRIETISQGTIDLEKVKYVEAPSEEKVEQYKLRRGDVLFSHINSDKHLGKTAYFDVADITLLHGINLLLMRFTDAVSSKYAHYLFNHYRAAGEFIKIAQRAVNQSSINQRKLNQLAFPLPPLPEQRRIVAKLEELFSKLDAGVAAVRRTQALLKRYRQSVLHAAVTGELTRAWREAHPAPAETGAALLRRIRAGRRAQWEAAQVAKRGGQLPLGDGWKSKYVEPEAVDTEGLPELPEGWVWASLPELGELNRGKSKHRPRDDQRLYGDAYPFIQTGDVRHANGIIRSYTQSYSEFGLAQSRLWPAGTLCITIAANIADTALLGFDACFPDSVVGFITPENHSNIKFVELFLRTAKENIERYAPATAQKNINLEILSKVGVPVPSLEEQKQIVDEAESRLTVLDALSQTLTDELKRAERLRQSILHRAFTGRLVPQDATDEPATALLTRLRETPAAPAKTKDGRGRKAVAQQTTLGL